MSDKPARLYLIDGSSYLYRAFFALPPLTSPTGVPTNAVYGFTTMLLKLLSDAAPDYLGVIWDPPGETFRDDLFEEYKANRPPMPDDLAAQIDLVHRVVEALHVRAVMLPRFEADDVIATLVHRFAPQGVECVVVTGDKDLMQLVGPRVRLWDTMRDRWFDEAAVEERMGVKPSQVVDVLALMGDSVDNIPGVRGIGEKTAVALIREFGALEAALARVDDVEKMSLRGAKKVAQLLRDGAGQARLSHELATLRADAPVDCGLDEFRLRPAVDGPLRELFQQLGFHTLLRQLAARASAGAAPAAAIREAQDLPAELAEAARTGRLAIAVVGEDGAAPSGGGELLLCGEGGPVLRLSLADAAQTQALRAALGDPRVELVAHDLKRDLLRLDAAGVSPGERAFDVMIASYLLGASTGHGLGELAVELLGESVPAFRADAAGTAAGVSLLPRIAGILRERLREADLEGLFHDVEMPLLRILADMERRGILLDVPALEGIGREFAGRLDALMKEIHELAGAEFNIHSPPQLREILFDRLKLPTRGVRKGKTGFSTDVDVLTRLGAVHPLPARILEYRNLSKLKSTYIDALPAAVNPATGRLHTHFNQAVAATGRLSSTNPNLQNIPIRGEEGRRIRAAFVAPGGSVLLSADYSQIELRVLAHLSQDQALLDAFRSDQDVHTRTATEVFGVLPGLITPDQRRAAKVINFGIIYGMGPQRLAAELGIPLAEAQEYIASYFRRYAGVRSYMEGVVREARERGYVSTLLGRRRLVPELRSRDRAAAQAAERAAANTPIQGSAADIIKVAMVRAERRLAREGLRAALLLQVHDELLLEAAEGDRESVARAVREEMEGALPLSVPLKVDVGFGPTWAAAH